MGYYSSLNAEVADQLSLHAGADGEPQQESGSNTPQATAPAEPEPLPAKEDETAKKEAQIRRVAAMSDDAAVAESLRCIAAAAEGRSPYSMEGCVAAHLRDKCRSDSALARMVLHPRKSMEHCIQYIYRRAREFLSKELKNKRHGSYGGNVPDSLCYQWAEKYFHDPDVKEDKVPEEKFISKSYTGTVHPAAQESAPKPAPKPRGYVDGQISLL